jgi:23S rRNA pseudouridine1911/1915/1917 synthase
MDEGVVATDEADLDQGAEVRAWPVANEFHGQRLDRVLSALVPEFSRNHLQSLIETGQVTLDGVTAATSSRKVRVRQSLQVRLVLPAQSLAFRPEPVPLNIVYQDDHVLVVNKPVGLVVHPAAGNWSGTLLNGLLAWDPESARLPRAGIVHRLDKDTSGLMVVGRSLEAVTALTRDIALRDVRRRYQALVHGRLPLQGFSVDAPIGRDPAARVRMAVVVGGKPARTDVEPVASTASAAAVWCQLHTGRTHQIRVHLASRGHPLLADVLYGGKPEMGLVRQALHAAELGFLHPISREPMRFSAPLPEDLAPAWAAVVSGAV